MFVQKLYAILKAARPNQWTKNLVVFTSLIFSGKLFDPVLFRYTFFGFVLFALLSSTSYIFNDIIDLPFDKKHPLKRKRPIASGELSVQDASFVVFLLSFVTLLGALYISIPLFAISLIFLLLHFAYSLYLKHRPIVDIFAISFSFMIRAFAGQVITGYHIQVWLVLSIFFISLFLATVKRHAELVVQGTDARLSLIFYKEHFLNFLSTTFATLTITTYSLYTFLETPPIIEVPLAREFFAFIPAFEARKWFMITIPLVAFGIARYAQLLYEREQGENPEKMILRDKPLVGTIVLWGLTVVSLIYLF